MKHKSYMQLTTAIFLVVGVVHLYRAFKGLDLVFGSSHIAPVWSWVGAVVGLYLAYSGYKLSNRS
ncbi:MAG: hypothetical protein KW788_03770 [Candidatus Doudnabacteria bacterium]|nr:hypothetical protein [Candidatus Doudnabacteria bacterium]